MAKLNQNLILSFICDLREINRVNSEMAQNGGECDCNSWRYPTLKCHEVDCDIRTKSTTDSASYILLLELIIDRIHFMVNLVINFLESLPIVSETHKLQRNVIRPKNLTLGALVSMFWQRMRTLQEHVNNKNTDMAQIAPNRGNFRVEMPRAMCIGTQTAEHCLTMCESCHAAMTFIKRLTADIESLSLKHGLSCAVIQLRRMMKHDIFKITQFAAMDRWISAIAEDVAMMVVNLDTTMADNKTLNEHVQNLTTTLEANEKQKKHLDQKCDYLEETNKKLDNKRQSLKKANKELELQVSKLESNEVSLQKRIKDMERIIEENELEIQVLTKRHDQDTKEAREAHEKERSALIEENTKLKKEVTVLSKENIELKDHIGETTQLLDSAKKKTRDVRKKLEGDYARTKEERDKYEHKAKELEINYTELKAAYDKQMEVGEEMKQKLEVELKEYEKKLKYGEDMKAKLENEVKLCKEREYTLIQYPDLNGSIQKEKSVHGDPLYDMEQQLRANMTRISLLQEQNVGLQRTLERLQKLNIARPAIKT